MGKRWLEGGKTILHSDRARAYTIKLDKVIHDNVVHKKQRKMIKGKMVW